MRLQQQQTQQQPQIFHKVIARVLFIARVFALLPVCNLGLHNVQDIRYSWLSLATFYAALIISLNVLEFSTVVNLVFTQGLHFHSSGTVSLYVVCLLEQAYFWRLALKWPFIMRVWRGTEEIFLRAPYHIYATYNMKRRIYAYTALVMLAAWVEHLLLVLNSFDKSEMERKQCKLNISYWESLYYRERHHLRLVLPFRWWFLPVLEWINLTLAFARSFTDVFIMCVSIGLTTYFRQLQLRVEAVHKKAMPTIFWTEIREHYLALKRLLRHLNAALSPLILLASANNMYFIGFQLFNSFQNIGVDSVAELGFWYSLVFAVLRTLLTLYMASIVNDSTNKILATVRDVPSGAWCLEIQRFREQLSSDMTALSGSGYFFMTRKLIIAMASSIITYELLVTDVINKGAIRQQLDYCK